MKNSNEIINKLKELKPDIEKRYDVVELGVFGSYVRNEQKESSDIDVLISFAENTKMTLFDFYEFENWLGEVLGKKVDLVIKKTLKSRIGKRILNEVVYL